MTEPRIEPGAPHPREEARTGLLVQTPFDAAFVSALKATIPVPDRAWLETERAWWVAPDHHATVIRLCLQAFDRVFVSGGASEPDYWVDRDGTVQQERLW